jgi:hypothetical protein
LGIAPRARIDLAESGEQIRDGLQRPDDAVAERERDTQPQTEQNRPDGHADQPGVLADP